MAYCCDIFSQDNVCTGCTAMDSFLFYFIFSNYRWGRCSFLATAQLVFLRATHAAHTLSLSLPRITFSVIKGRENITYILIVIAHTFIVVPHFLFMS